jgi:hypothetical protein
MATSKKLQRKIKGGPKPGKPPDSRPMDALEEAMLEEGTAPGQSAELPRRTARELANELLKHPAEWLDSPNPQFGGRRPNDLLDTDEEKKVINLLLCVELGLF